MSNKEKRALEFYHHLIKNQKGNAWKHSPCEIGKVDRFARRLNEESIKDFRRNGLIFNPKQPSLLHILKYLSVLITSFKFKFSEVDDVLVGNPYYYNLLGNKVTDDSIKAYFLKKYIEREIPNVDSVLEIGGGFGALRERLNVGFYAIVDLPEILPLTFYYSEKVGKDTTCIAPWELPGLDKNFDLFINVMSFQHMTKKNLDYYFSEIKRLKPKHLFILNRNHKRDPTDVKMDDYPIPKEYQLIKSDKYPFSNHLIRIYRYQNQG